MPFINTYPIGTSPFVDSIIMGDFIDPVNSYYDFQSGTNKSYQTMTIYNVLFQVIQQKRIESDVLQGRNYTVKEYIALGDYEVIMTITLSSFDSITSAGPLAVTNQYPDDLISQLNDIIQANIPIPIVNSFLNSDFGIFYLVPHRMDLQQKAGNLNQQEVIIRAWSDSPVNVTITEGLSIFNG